MRYQVTQLKRNSISTLYARPCIILYISKMAEQSWKYVHYWISCFEMSWNNVWHVWYIVSIEPKLTRTWRNKIIKLFDGLSINLLSFRKFGTVPKGTTGKAIRWITGLFISVDLKLNLYRYKFCPRLLGSLCEYWIQYKRVMIARTFRGIFLLFQSACFSSST